MAAVARTTRGCETRAQTAATRRSLDLRRLVNL